MGPMVNMKEMQTEIILTSFVPEWDILELDPSALETTGRAGGIIFKTYSYTIRLVHHGLKYWMCQISFIFNLAAGADYGNFKKIKGYETFTNGSNYEFTEQLLEK